VPDTNSQTESQVDTAPDTPPETDTDNCEVCLLAPGTLESRFCSACADRVRDEGRGCPLCRADITLILNLYSGTNCQTELNVERCKFTYT